MTVHLVIVSHSDQIASGVCDLAGQMGGGGVRLIAAGGTEEGGLGTSAPRIQAALEDALSDPGDAALVLLDLGSAAMNTALALELLDEDQRARVQVAQAPIVEGAVLAAVSAAGGADLATVAAEAASGRDMPKQL
ncbi:dihydroxyacetone kinase phosphoryl donor subunit DhaM [Deinococcus sp. Marseille-Q6407]|uniref:dihydroxyacetone kinase phosphoryl donor subunit DhaM n=1 Tax=Deinococcus sp. Marseille-Q6407 TaxID=2969223 RepID=UPI0021BF9391|nr:dihydroxyacetone kinase phosphoryl donor subunit DhaM [Deinococcus sp. Marseille-Q6407]